MVEKMSRRDFGKNIPGLLVGFAALAGASIIEHSNVASNTAEIQDLQNKVDFLIEQQMQRGKEYPLHSADVKGKPLSPTGTPADQGTART